jgi:hypothetical protein
MPYDSLLRPASTLLGAGAAVNSTLLGGASGALNTVMDFGGANVEVESHLRVNGTVSGTGPSLTLKYQESADGSTSWTDIAGGAHAAVTATMQSAVGLGGGGPTGGSSDPARITFRTTKRYVRVFITLANADNSFGGTSIGIQPTAGSRPTVGRS